MGKTLPLLPPNLATERESTGNIASAGREENESGNRIPRCDVPFFCVSFRFILFMQSKFSIQSSAIRIDLSEMRGRVCREKPLPIAPVGVREREREREREQLRFDENPLRLARALPPLSPLSSPLRRPYNRPHS